MLHLDTGMTRLGLPPGEVERLPPSRRGSTASTLAAILSHLACADEPAHPMNRRSATLSRAALRGLPPAPASLAASSGIFLGRRFSLRFRPPRRRALRRQPAPGSPNPMRQVVRLKGKILQVRDVDRGRSVGYGAAHRMRAAGRIATIAVGYADGWLRSPCQSRRARHRRPTAPVVGRISMDL